MKMFFSVSIIVISLLIGCPFFITCSVILVLFTSGLIFKKKEV